MTSSRSTLIAVACCALVPGIAAAAPQPGARVEPAAAASAPSLAWTPIGPTGAARLAAIAVSPSQPIVYAAGARGRGFFRSPDGGRTWERRGDFAAGAIAVDATDPDRVFAAADRLYRSPDGGRTWVPTPLAGRVLDVATAAGSAFAYALVDGTLHRSGDGGETWQALQLERVTALGLGPAGLVVATTATAAEGVRVRVSTDAGGTWTSYRTPVGDAARFISAVSRDRIYVAGPRRVLRTRDGGRTWDDVTPPTEFQAHGNILDFAADPAAPDVVLALQQRHVTRSSDGGATWAPLVSDPTRRDMTLARSLRFGGPGGSTLYLNTGASGVWTSGDRGSVWRSANGNLTVTQASDVVARDPRRIDVSTDTDVYRTFDGGRTWQSLGFGERVRSIAVDRAGAVYAAKSDQGVWKKLPGGAPRRVLETTWVATDVVLAPSDYRRVFVSTWSSDHYDAQYRSLDGGRTWRAIDTGPLRDSDEPRFSVHPRDARIVYAANWRRLLRSTDGGSTWRVVPGVRTSGASPRFDVREPRRLYVRDGRRLLRSEDGGSSWTSAAPLPGGIASFAPDPRAARRVWAASGAGFLHRSDNAGRSWRRVAALALPPRAGGRSTGDPEWSGDFPRIDPVARAVFVPAAGAGLYRAPLPP